MRLIKRPEITGSVPTELCDLLATTKRRQPFLPVGELVVDHFLERRDVNCATIISGSPVSQDGEFSTYRLTTTRSSSD